MQKLSKRRRTKEHEKQKPDRCRCCGKSGEFGPACWFLTVPPLCICRYFWSEGGRNKPPPYPAQVPGWWNRDRLKALRSLPYRASYPDENGNTKKFLKANEAIVIPKSEKVYEVVYGRADHTEAVKVAPKMFFAATPQELERGKGYAIDTEMKAMPYCTRPSALINLVFSN